LFLKIKITARVNNPNLKYGNDVFKDIKIFSEKKLDKFIIK
jgi:hypothetical protein